MNEPLISIIMPTYNLEDFIKESIDSILNQDYKNLELIIIDDFSSDHTSEIVNELSRKDNRILLYRTYTRISNVAKLLNIGIKLSNGDIIARQDADDISSKYRISKQLQVLNDGRSNIALVGSKFYLLTSRGTLVKEDKKITAIFLSVNNEKIPILHGTWMFKKSLIDDVGLYDETFPFGQDFEFLLRLRKYGRKIITLPDYLYTWRCHNNNISLTFKKERQRLIAKAKEIYSINFLT